MQSITVLLICFVALVVSFSCPAQVCQTQIGDTCLAKPASIYQCKNGLYCDGTNFVCQPNKGVGDECKSDGECSENLSCTMGLPPQSNCSASSVQIQYSLTSTSGMNNAPYTIGHGFRKGDVPTGSTVGSTIPLQVIPRTYWPDGSLKFAMLSAYADFSSLSRVDVVLSVVTPSSAGTALTLANLKTTGITASVGAGGFGTVNWSDSDWDTPFQVWAEGSIMSSWVYRKPIGSDAHLVAWLEVRLYSSGAVEVLPWVENGYLQVPLPFNKNATYSFSLGGAVRVSVQIDLKHHQRTPIINGTELSYWLATDPLITPNHDKKYMQATNLVPTYSANVPSNNVYLPTLPLTYSPLQQGNFDFYNDAMTSPGYQSPIGLFPQHDVLHLTANDARTYGSVIRNGFSAGRYPIHYRDETTNRPLRFSQYPNLVISDGSGFSSNGASSKYQTTPRVNATSPYSYPPSWDTAHSPSVGYMAYQLTGRWYFMEEIQFAATANFLGKTNTEIMRNYSSALVQTTIQAWQTRACAWDWRSIAHALCVTPSSDSVLQQEFINAAENNIRFFYKQYVAQPNNPWGWIYPGETYGNSIRFGATWQQDFVTMAFGHSLALGLPVSPTVTDQLAAFFQWKAKSIVLRLGTKSDFWYINAAPYTMAITPVNFPDYLTGTGPWYTTAAEVYNATYTPPPSFLGNTEGVLAGEILPGHDSMWGNLLPAIAFAVQFNVPGAVEGYNRLKNASTWGVLMNALNVRPVWSVTPPQNNVTCKPPSSQEVLSCSAAIYGPGISCSSDTECYFRNTTGQKHTSNCVNNKCFGLGEGVTCTGDDQCNVGYYCKAGSTCTALGSVNQACATTKECKSNLFCGNQTSQMICLEYGKGVLNSFCLDNNYCGDEFFCDTTSKSCIAKISQASGTACNFTANCTQPHEICSCKPGSTMSTCAPPLANPAGYAKALTDMYTCWSDNPRCRKGVPCASCSTQICALYKVSPSFFGPACGANAARAAALALCGPLPTTTTTTATTATTTTSTTASAATSGSTTAKSSTSSSSTSATSSSPSPSSSSPATTAAPGGTTTSNDESVAVVLLPSLLIVSLLSLMLASL